ncbi:carbohydrate ABC transporter permease [Cellulosilyticum sp. I15G10I2]|uniref:carbohydrate ABC transporter permease n=1 Tax=Cellulosilyticum sp. I15G10I2 TaxID=1892843 RepID=UPI00085CA012|nr:carbohydrate ABC transporter permease [Cellulosilyticum sp. I15G10I2]
METAKKLNKTSFYEVRKQGASKNKKHGINNIKTYGERAILLLIAAIQIYPLLWLIMFSLKSNPEIFGKNPLALPQKLLFENYARAFLDGNIGRYFINSIIVTVVSVIITNILAAMASYAIARMKWKLSGTMLIIFLLGLMIPMHSTLLPLFIFLKKTQLYNTYVALILPYIGFSLPMAIFVLVGFFGTLPRELEESACLDGANIYQIFAKIMLPLIKPAVATISIFTYLSCWNELMFATTFVSKQEYKTLTVGIMGMVGQYATRWGELGAGLVIATIPTVLIYISMSKQVQKSFTTGALKG